MQSIQGLHHITALASDPQANLDFYQEVHGQRLVKTTVNFDDPNSYHLYYADQTGSPGTVLTFFHWNDYPPARPGVGDTTAVAYAIASNALDYWRERLSSFQISVQEDVRFGAPVISFADPDGLPLELVVQPELAEVVHWPEGPIPFGKHFHGLSSVTLSLHEIEPTAELLTDLLGYHLVGQEGIRYRYQASSSLSGLFIDLLHLPEAPNGQFGSGAVHHIAFRAQDDAEQLAYRQHLSQAGFRVSQVRDRQYFHSIYFRSPGGVLFEIATDGPGFLIDEPLETLGESLMLPPWLEAQRPAIQRALPPLNRQLSPNRP